MCITISLKDWDNTIVTKTKSDQGTWTTIEGDFKSVFVMLDEYAATDLSFFPEAKLDDGLMWIHVIHETSRMEFIKVCFKASRNPRQP